jgi:hypothetical protein
VEDLADYVDDVSIEGTAALWRRVPPYWLVKDENLGTVRPSSAAFQDSQNGTPMSVLIEKVVTQTQRTAADTLRDFEGFSLCSFTASTARDLGQSVATRPVEPLEPAHGFIVGKKTERVRRGFVRAAAWVVLRV